MDGDQVDRIERFGDAGIWVRQTEIDQEIRGGMAVPCSLAWALTSKYLNHFDQVSRAK